LADAGGSFFFLKKKEAGEWRFNGEGQEEQDKVSGGLGGPLPSPGPCAGGLMVSGPFEGSLFAANRATWVLLLIG